MWGKGMISMKGTANKLELTRKLGTLCLLTVLSACATRPASVPDTTILAEIQETLDMAIMPTEAELAESEQDSSDLLDELIPSLSLDENLLAPVEVRTSISTRENNFEWVIERMAR